MMDKHPLVILNPFVVLFCASDFSKIIFEKKHFCSIAVCFIPNFKRVSSFFKSCFETFVEEPFRWEVIA